MQTNSALSGLHIKVIAASIPVQVVSREQGNAVQRLMHVANQMNQLRQIHRPQFRIWHWCRSTSFHIAPRQTARHPLAWAGFKGKVRWSQRVINEMPVRMVILAAASPDFIGPSAAAHEDVGRQIKIRIGVIGFFPFHKIRMRFQHCQTLGPSIRVKVPGKLRRQ